MLLDENTMLPALIANCKRDHSILPVNVCTFLGEEHNYPLVTITNPQ